MLPKQHIIYGFFFSASIYYLFQEIGFLGFSIIWAASVLIDVDHYLFYIYDQKDWNLKNAFNWFTTFSRKFKNLSKREKKQYKFAPCIFHGIEVATILFIFSFYSIYPLLILIGFIFHQFLDFLGIKRLGYRLNHIGLQTVNILNYFKND